MKSVYQANDGRVVVSTEVRHDFADGKYTVINNNGKLTALRHGEPWARDLIGDNLVYWMLVRVDQLVAENEGLKESFESVLSQLKERDAELEQAKKDVERYQWLRKSHHDDDSAIGVTREHMNGWGRVVGKSLRNSDLDKAIDEAIAKEQS